MSTTYPAVKALAEQMFVAEYGHTGISYHDFSEDSHQEWEKRASRVLEGWWSPDAPNVVINLREDTLRLAADGELV